MNIGSLKFVSVRQTFLGPLLRPAAGLVLLLFISAQSLCFAHCLSPSAPQETTAKGCCQAKAAASSACHQTGDATPAGGGGMTCCATLKNFAPGSASLTVVAPEFLLLDAVLPVALGANSNSDRPVALVLRQHRPSDWVLTPEVSIGPAHRALAPPPLA